MNIPNYILQAVANTLLTRQEGRCESCDAKDPHCILFAPRDAENVVNVTVDDLTIHCEECALRMEGEAKVSKEGELERLEKLTNVDIDE